MRMNLVAIAVLVVMVCGSTGSTAMAQEPPPQAPSPTSPKKVQNLPLELQVIISRYQAEKRISSLPYVLSLKSFTNSNRAGFAGASLRLGSRVPIRSQVFAPPSDGKPVTTTSVNYENVGTNIDAGASALEDGRFEVTISINESSVVTDPQDLKATPGSDSYPVFRSYQSTNTLFVKEGQSTQFTAASDRVSGEVVRVEVKLTVVK